MKLESLTKSKAAHMNKKCASFKILAGSVDFSMVIKDFSEFSGQSYTEVIEKIETSLKSLASEWHNYVKTCSSLEISRFYSESNYIYEVLLSYLHPEKLRKKQTCIDIVEYVKRTPGEKVMEFGGGIGQLCLMVYFNTDKKVTYVDLPGRVSDFARWRFRKYDADINIVYSKIDAPDLGEEAYDIIISDATLEHVVDLAGTLLALSKSLKKGGKVYLLFDTTCDERFPMHVSAGKNVEKPGEKVGLNRLDNYVYVKSNTVLTRLRHLVFLLVPNPMRLVITAINHPKKTMRRVLQKLNLFQRL